MIKENQKETARMECGKNEDANWNPIVLSNESGTIQNGSTVACQIIKHKKRSQNPELRNENSRCR